MLSGEQRMELMDSDGQKVFIEAVVSNPIFATKMTKTKSYKKSGRKMQLWIFQTRQAKNRQKLFHNRECLSFIFFLPKNFFLCCSR
jgi:hypothetical protein